MSNLGIAMYFFLGWAVCTILLAPLIIATLRWLSNPTEFVGGTPTATLPPPGYGQVRLPGYKYGYDYNGNLVQVVLTVDDQPCTIWGREDAIPYLVLQSEGRWIPVS